MSYSGVAALATAELWMRRYLKYFIPVLTVYVALLGGLFFDMLRPPPVFGHFMSKLPALNCFLLPFEPMWLVAVAATESG